MPNTIELAIHNFQFPIPTTRLHPEWKQLGSDYRLVITKPGQLLIYWEYTTDCKLSDAEKAADLKGDELRISLDTAKKRGYAYYTDAPKSKCNCLALRRTTGRTCRFCEYKKRNSEEFLEQRKQRERGTDEQKRKNNEKIKQNYPNKTKDWRMKKDPLGRQPGMERTNKINRDYAKRNPSKIKLIRGMHQTDKYLATPLWGNHDAILKIEAQTIEQNARGIETDTDHYIPLRGGIRVGNATFQLVCGLHCEDNLRSISRGENLNKSNRIPKEYSNVYSNDDIDYLRAVAKSLGLTANGYLPEEEKKRLYDEKKQKHPHLLKASKNRGPNRNKYVEKSTKTND
ncbi:hypothetical protein [Vibrio maerlii]|uniref:hypothetical protein n=1 Tax=Vibrio maerlii TaxID=2231648 RepID=UPI000E3E3716|nr:hypothetical protein [Vibrio maerlii]